MEKIAEDSIPSWRSMDPDISGPGVRISFYLQTFFLVVLVNRSWQDAPIALWTCIAMSFGLTVAVIANLKFITLLEVLQVCNLVWLANIGIFVSLASYSRQKAGSRKARQGHHIIDYKVKFGAMFQTLFSMALTVAMWSRIEHIGGPAGNTEVQYVFFVWGMKAIGTGKFVGLAFSSVLLALYASLSVREMYSFCGNPRRKTPKAPVPSPSPTSELKLAFPPSPVTHTPRSPSSTDQPCSPSVDSPPTLDVEGTTRSRLRRPRRRRWISHNLDPMFVGILIIEFLVWIYFVVSCEILIARNKADNGEATGFGQIVALAVVTPSLLSMVSAIRENGFGRLSGKKDRRRSRAGNRSRRRPNGASEEV